ncbi:MAG: ParA family protein [Bacteroidota bacterium]
MILSCISYKGGVGKSTLSQNLAVCLAHAGEKVCIIDADESQNTAYWQDARSEELPTVQVVKLVNDKTIAIEASKLYKTYDYLIIDSPPSQSVIADKIIMLSHMVLVPVTPKGSSEINTAEQFLLQVQNLEVLKEKKIPTFFVINEFDSRPILHKQFVERFKEFTAPPLHTMIHQRVAYGEANLLGKGVLEHSDAKARKEVIQLYNEIMDLSDKL